MEATLMINHMKTTYSTATAILYNSLSTALHKKGKNCTILTNHAYPLCYCFDTVWVPADLCFVVPGTQAMPIQPQDNDSHQAVIGLVGIPIH